LLCFGVEHYENDAPWLGEPKVNHSGPGALTPARQFHSHFAQATRMPDQVTRFRMCCEFIFKEPECFFIGYIQRLRR